MKKIFVFLLGLLVGAALTILVLLPNVKRVTNLLLIINNAFRIAPLDSIMTAHRQNVSPMMRTTVAQRAINVRMKLKTPKQSAVPKENVLSLYATLAIL